MGELGGASDQMREKVGENSTELARTTERNVMSEVLSLGKAQREYNKTAESYEDMIRRMARAKRSMLSLEKDKELLGIPAVGDASQTMRSVGEEAADGFSSGFGSKLRAALPRLFTMGSMGAVVLGAAIPLMSIVGLLAGGALVGGLGAGMAGLGLMAAAKSEPVKLVFTDLANDIQSEMARISKPFERTMLDIATDARDVFEAFRDEWAKAFPETAEAISEFSLNVADAFRQLAPAVGPIMDAFNRILDELGPRLPGVFQDIANALIQLAENISQNADGFANFVVLLLGAIPATIEFINALINMGNWFFSTTRLIVDNISFTASIVINWFRSMGETVAGWATWVGNSVGRARDEVVGRLTAMIQDFRNWPSHIANAVGDLGRVLWNAGVRLVSGLIDGIKSQFARVRDTLLNLTSMMPSWKGPEDVDRHLLTNSGQLIMGSLVDGFKQGESEIEQYLQSLTGFIGAFGPDGVRVLGETRLTDSGSGGSAGRGGPQRVALGSDGSRVGDALLRLIQEAIRDAGGDPAVLGV